MGYGVAGEYDINQACSFDRIKYAFGHYMQGYHKFFVPTSPALQEFAERPFSEAVFVAPGRLVDDITEMMANYRKTSDARLPVIILGFDKEPRDIQGDFSRQLSDEVWVTVPCDDKQRHFKMRQIQQERRVQIAFVGADEPTVSSLAVQFARSYITRYGNDRMKAKYDLLGMKLDFPIMIMKDDLEFSNASPEEKNLTILTLDINARESMPIFTYPEAGSPDADGKGDGACEPDGYRGLRTILYHHIEETGVTRIRLNEQSKHASDPDGSTNLCG